MKKESINDFFINLAVYGSENSLSDVIAAAYNSNSEFRKLFIKFFFKDDKVLKRIPSGIQREVSSGNCRYDLVIPTEESDYIVENKVYDQNDHYDKYKKRGAKIAFIANYDVNQIQYKNKHTWKEFYNYIKKSLKKISKDKILISCVLDYIKGVCDMMEEKQFNIKEVKYLGYAVKVVQKILKEMGFKINYKAKGSSEEKIGFWVEKDNRAYWFGFYFTEADYGFWGEIYNDKIKTKSFTTLKYAEYDKDSTEDSVWFKLKKSKITLLNSTNQTYEQKRNILKDFISEIEKIK